MLYAQLTELVEKRMKWENITGDTENQDYIDEHTLSCRYLLEKKGKKELIVLGLNPSTADFVEPDRTMRRVCLLYTSDAADD